MTTPVSTQQVIRELADAGVSDRQIARRLGLSRNTVAKYVGKEDFSLQPNIEGPKSIVDPFAAVIAGWLEEDLRMPRKQRHTAKRVWERLVDEHGFTGSYETVSRWVKRYRLEHRQLGVGYSELVWDPGVAQADYGEAQAIIDGHRQTVHVLVVSFPYSNARYAVATPGETAECVCSGLRQVFEHISAVPTKIVFDNATGIGHRKADGTVTTTRVFEAFRTHYGIRAVFTNPDAGNEKGSVENAVGFLRRNLMVPLPAAQSLPGLSRALLERCEGLLDKEHYRKRAPIRELFEADKKACKVLPRVGFDPCTWQRRVVDLVGNISIDQVRYLVGPEHAHKQVHVGIRAATVEILDQGGARIVEHERCYTQQAGTVIDPAALLAALIKRPGTLRNSVIRSHLPAPLLDYLTQAEVSEQRRIWRIMTKACQHADFATVAATITALLDTGRPIDEASTIMAAKAGTESPTGAVIDLSRYDKLIRKGA